MFRSTLMLGWALVPGALTAGPVYELLTSVPPGELAMSPSGTAFVVETPPNSARSYWWDPVTRGIAQQSLSGPYTRWQTSGALRVATQREQLGSVWPTLPVAQYDVSRPGLPTPPVEADEYPVPQGHLTSGWQFEDSAGNPLRPRELLFSNQSEFVRAPGCDGLYLVRDGERIMITTDDSERVFHFEYDPPQDVVGYAGHDFVRVDVATGARLIRPNADAALHQAYEYHLAMGTPYLILGRAQDAPGHVEETLWYDLVVVDQEGQLIQEIDLGVPEVNAYARDIMVGPDLLVFGLANTSQPAVRVFRRIQE